MPNCTDLIQFVSLAGESLLCASFRLLRLVPIGLRLAAHMLFLQ